MSDKNLLQLSFPLLLNALAGMAVMLVDTWILAKYSENAAAAVSIANQILLVAFDLSSIFAAGAVVLVARKLGSEQPGEAAEFGKTAIIGNAIVSILLGIIIFVFAPQLVQLINCPSEIASDATTYLFVGAFTILFNGMMMAATATLRGYGEMRTILILGLAAYAIYLLAELVFIFGWGPIPEMGVFGSALATLLVRALAVIALGFVLLQRLLNASKQTTTESNPKSNFTRRLGSLLEISWPLAIDNLAYGFYQMILVSFIARFSVAMVLSRTFTLVLSSVLTVSLMSISQANEVMIGYRHGANRKNEFNRCVTRATIASSLLTVALAVLIWSFSQPLVGLFTEDETIHRLARQLLLITIFVQPFSCLNTILYFSLKAIGDVIVPVAGTQIMMWCLSVPIAWLLAVHFGWGVIGLWYVLLMEEALKAAFLLVRWRMKS